MFRIPSLQDWKKPRNSIALFLAIGTLVVDLAFWAAALEVSPSGSCESWSSTPPGRYLPWPEESGPFLMISPMSPVDSAICSLATSGLIVFVIVGDVALLAFIGRLIGKYIERRGERNG